MIERGLRGITSTGGTIKFGGIWSFIIGAQVAFTLLCLPAAAGISSNLLRDQSALAEFPAERYLTFRLSMDNEALAGEHGVPDNVSGYGNFLLSTRSRTHLVVFTSCGGHQRASGALGIKEICDGVGPIGDFEMLPERLTYA